MNKLTLLVSGIFAFLLVVGMASAEVSQINDIKYGIIQDDNSLTTTNQAINGANAIGYVCSNDDCSSFSSALWGGNILTTGNSQITLTYPTVLMDHGYGVYVYKEGYFPYEIKASWNGNGAAPEDSAYLTRMQSCRVPINDLAISHNGNNITVNVTLYAGVSSPVQNAGPLTATPNSIASLYSVDSVINFSFNGSQNVNMAREVNLPASQNQRVSVTANNLAAGNYTIVVQSNTNDVKCLTSIPVTVSDRVEITGNRPEIPLPVVSILSPEAKTYGSNSILVNLYSSNATSVWYNWNGTNVSYNGPVYVNFNNGVNTLNAFASNSIATSEASVTFNVANSGLPTLNIVSPTSQTYNNRTILLNITANNATSVWYNWNGTNVSYVSPVFVAFNEGTNSLTTYAVNGLGTISQNVAFYVNSSMIDTTAPGSVYGLYSSDRGEDYIVWNWNNPPDSDFSQAIIYLNGVNVANTSNNTYRASGLNYDTEYNITINTKDFSGNLNTSNVSDSERTLRHHSTSSSSSTVNTIGRNGLEPYNPAHNGTNNDDDQGAILLSNSLVKKDSNSLLWALMILLLVGVVVLVILLLTAASRPRRSR